MTGFLDERLTEVKDDGRPKTDDGTLKTETETETEN